MPTSSFFTSRWILWTVSSPVALETPGQSRVGRGIWSSLLVGLAALALLGFVGYGIFLLFATRGESFAGGGYLIVAMVAGAGAFFSPCSFPLLPSYFAYAQVFRRADTPASRSLHTLAAGSAAAAGVVSFNVLLGLALGLVGLGFAQTLVLLSPQPSSITLAARTVVGSSLIVLGILQVGNLSIHTRFVNRVVRAIQSRTERRGSLVGLFLYGFGYTLIGIGCTAPFLATVIVLALAAGGLAPALAGFLAFSLTMAALMVLVSFVASSSRSRLLKGLTERTPAIKRAGGAVLVAFGGLLILLTAWPGLLRPLFP